MCSRQSEEARRVCLRMCKQSENEEARTEGLSS